MRRKLLLTFLLSISSILSVHAEWLIAECSAYTPYDCGTITATGETVHVGVEYIVNDRCGIESCIDIFRESYEDAIEFGRQYKEVYVKR